MTASSQTCPYADFTISVAATTLMEALHRFSPAENAQELLRLDLNLTKRPSDGTVISSNDCTGKCGDPDGAKILRDVLEQVVIVVESVDMVRARQERMDSYQQQERLRQSKRELQIFILLMFIVLLILLVFILLL